MQARAAIYLDANAGAPLSEAARVALFSLLCVASAEVSGRVSNASGASARDPAPGAPLIPNPSSAHAEGRKAKSWLRLARAQVASSLGVDVSPDDLIFVSSGTEAAQGAIRSVLEPRFLLGEKPHWILAAGDHEAHRALIAWVEARGGSVSVLPLDSAGAPAAGELSRWLRPETALVSAVWVNNETGVITDAGALSEICQRHSVPLHLDGAQAWGKIAFDLAAGPAQLVSFSGHKIGALAGTGVLWRSGGLARGSAVFPGKQEGGLRGGTENLAGIVSLGAAAGELDPLAWQNTVGPLRDWLEREISRRISGVRIHGAGAKRVANTSYLGFAGIEKDGLVAALDLAGYCISSGSACSSGITEPSPVLLALGLTPAQARSSVRISLHGGSRREELEGFVTALALAVEKARGRAGQVA